MVDLYNYGCIHGGAAETATTKALNTWRAHTGWRLCQRQVMPVMGAKHMRAMVLIPCTRLWLFLIHDGGADFRYAMVFHHTMKKLLWCE